jgi:hypothetical protein
MASPGPATATTADGNTLTAKVTGLTTGTQYAFTVFASNIIGDGPSSSTSNAVTALTTLPAPGNVVACGSDGQHINVSFVSFAAVGGASSYDVFINSTSPATAGTKTNIAGTSTTLTPGAGTWYVAVATVNVIGDGPASPDRVVQLDTHVHDTLFVGSFSATVANVVYMYDCYSQLPYGTSAPSRTLSTNVSTVDASFGVDDVNAIIYMDYSSSVLGYNGAKTIDGFHGTADRNVTISYLGTTQPSAGGGGIAIDTVNNKFYAANFNGGTIYRLGYTASALNGAAEATLKEGSTGNNRAIALNPATGDLWVATSTGGVLMFSVANNAADLTTASKTFKVSGANYGGLAYAPAAGGTIYTSTYTTSGALTVYWLTGIDGLASGTYSPTNSLAVASSNTSDGSLAYGNSLLFVIPTTTTTSVWSTTSLTASPLKTVTMPAIASNNSTLFYVP